MYFILACIFWTSASHALVEKRAVVRDSNFNAVIEEVSLPDLTSDHSYEGKFFKIVHGKNDEAVRFDDSEDLQLKAATTYYHLSKARKFFAEFIKSSYVQNLPQITIRLDLTNVLMNLVTLLTTILILSLTMLSQFLEGSGMSREISNHGDRKSGSDLPKKLT